MFLIKVGFYLLQLFLCFIFIHYLILSVLKIISFDRLENDRSKIHCSSVHVIRISPWKQSYSSRHKHLWSFWESSSIWARRMVVSTSMTRNAPAGRRRQKPTRFRHFLLMKVLVNRRGHFARKLGISPINRYGPLAPDGKDSESRKMGPISTPRIQR